MKIEKTSIEGVLLITPFRASDERGSFVKHFHEKSFKEAGLVTHFPEEFYSISKKGVIRGLHFQTPPADHVKLVGCFFGRVLDAIVDLRRGSPTFGSFETFELDGDTAQFVYIPQGLAHGFETLTDSALMYYAVTTMHSPEHDAGIRWNSVGIPWRSENPILSTRDEGFPLLAEFETPFVLEECLR